MSREHRARVEADARQHTRSRTHAMAQELYACTHPDKGARAASGHLGEHLVGVPRERGLEHSLHHELRAQLAVRSLKRLLQFPRYAYLVSILCVSSVYLVCECSNVGVFK